MSAKPKAEFRRSLELFKPRFLEPGSFPSWKITSMQHKIPAVPHPTFHSPPVPLKTLYFWVWEGLYPRQAVKIDDLNWFWPVKFRLRLKAGKKQRNSRFKWEKNVWTSLDLYFKEHSCKKTPRRFSWLSEGVFYLILYFSSFLLFFLWNKSQSAFLIAENAECKGLKNREIKGAKWWKENK